MTQEFTISKKYSSNSFDNRIKFLIIHSTDRDFETSLKLLSNQVSAHYLISDKEIDGNYIFNLVDEEKRAWHSGASFWKGRSNLNDSSIGIEIVNLDGNKNTYNEKQIEAVIYLCKKLITKYQILPENILAHSDISPSRKIDPGILFPWQKLYKNGIGIMPNQEKVAKLQKTISLANITKLQQDLSKFGYQINITGKFDEQTKLVLNAFRRHFCPDLIGKELDKKSYATLLSFL